MWPGTVCFRAIRICAETWEQVKYVYCPSGSGERAGARPPRQLVMGFDALLLRPDTSLALPRPTDMRLPEAVGLWVIDGATCDGRSAETV